MASGSVSPITLPSGERKPAALRLGFASWPIGGGQVPELRSIGFGIDSRVRFRRDLPSCPLSELYEAKRRPCPGSVVGQGWVASEITPEGSPPAAVEGKLVAFYSQTHRQARILARVVTGEPLPVVYVIPFKIDRADGGFGPRLTATRERMHRIVGKCVADHPNCFAQPYALKGAYSRISRFKMSLERGFVEASCPATSRDESEKPLLRADLDFEDEADATVTVPQVCHAAG